jgi:Zn2+/Cd2+-exporting ATPase
MAASLRHASRDAERPAQREGPTKPPRLGVVLVVVCLASAIVGWIIRPSDWALLAFGIAYLTGGTETTIGALRQLARGRLSIDLLMIVAAIGAAVIGEWLEGAILLFLFSFSHVLETYAMFRTTRSVQALMKLRPSEAVRIEDGSERRVPIGELAVDDLLRIRPGELYPSDGEVVEGETEADEATLTGESMPIAKHPGDPVFAGTMNQRGTVVVRITNAPGDTTLDKIIRMVQEAQADKPEAQQFVEKWAPWYVASVFILSGAVLLGGYLIEGSFDNAFYRAMVLLVAASPCAVVAASPSVVLAAIARAARNGVLFKRGSHVEMLGEITTFAFDKTGTITRGKPHLTDLWIMDGMEEDRILQLCASLEHFSEHHLGVPIVREAQRRGLELLPVEGFEAHPGKGVEGFVDGQRIAIGREELFESLGIEISPEVRDRVGSMRARGETALIVLIPDMPSGGAGAVIGVADRARDDAAPAIAALRRLGIERFIMLTGDHSRIAQTIGDEVGMDEVHADLLPEDKVRLIKDLQSAVGGSSRGGLAMVGDGVNDAPALASASIGIAMGGAGTEAALEVADVVLMRDDLGKLAFAVWLSRTGARADPPEHRVRDGDDRAC